MKRIIALLDLIASLIKQLAPFAMMAALNAVTGLICLFTGWRLGAVTFGIFGIIWGLIALAVALKKQHEDKKKLEARAGETKPI